MVNVKGQAAAFGVRQVRRCLAGLEALLPAPLTFPVRRRFHHYRDRRPV